MTKLNQLEILNNKIKVNEAQICSIEKTLRYLQSQVVN